MHQKLIQQIANKEDKQLLDHFPGISNRWIFPFYSKTWSAPTLTAVRDDRLIPSTFVKLTILIWSLLIHGEDAEEREFWKDFSCWDYPRTKQLSGWGC